MVSIGEGLGKLADISKIQASEGRRSGFLSRVPEAMHLLGTSRQQLTSIDVV